jgi:hypothetical protein
MDAPMEQSRSNVAKTHTRLANTRNFCGADILFLSRISLEITKNLRQLCPEILSISSILSQKNLLTLLQDVIASTVGYESFIHAQKAVQHRKGSNFLPSITLNYTTNINQQKLTEKVQTAVSEWILQAGVSLPEKIEYHCRWAVGQVMASRHTKLSTPTIYIRSSGLGDNDNPESAASIINNCLGNTQTIRHFNSDSKPTMLCEHTPTGWIINGSISNPLGPKDVVVWTTAKQLPKSIRAVFSGLTKKGINVYLARNMNSDEVFLNGGPSGVIEYQYDDKETWNLYGEFDAGKAAAKAIQKTCASHKQCNK